MKVGTRTSIVINDALAVGLFLVNLITSNGQLLCALDAQLNGKEGYTSPSTRIFFLIGAASTWGMILLGIGYFIWAYFRCQRQIQEEIKDRKTSEKFEEDLESGIDHLKGIKTNTGRQNKKTGKTNKLLNKINQNLITLVSLGKKNSRSRQKARKVARREICEVKNEIARAHKMNDFNLKVLMSQSDPSKVYKRNRTKSE